MENITSHLIDIILSALIVSVIKSITACFIYSDRIFLKSKELNDVDEEEQFNNNLIKIMSKNMVIFILNYIFQFIFWVYVGSFCAVYKNSQTFLIINGIICFFAVLILNFLYYFFPALLRMISLGMVKPDQFTTDEYGRSIIDDNDCYHTLITEFEKMFSKECKLFRKTDNHWHSVVRSINDHIDDLAFSFSRYLKSNTPLHAMRVRPCKDI